jgi:L-ribulokinase
VAGKKVGGYATFPEAQAAMCGIKEVSYKPDPENHQVYQKLYKLYSQLHDALGRKDWSGSLYNVMKDLLAIRESQTREDRCF